MLGTAQPHAFGAELARGAAIVGRLGIGTHLEAADLVRSDHQRAEIARQLGLDGGDGARHHLAGDRKSVVSGKSASVRVDIGGRRLIKHTSTRLYPRYPSTDDHISTSMTVHLTNHNTIQ